MESKAFNVLLVGLGSVGTIYGWRLQHSGLFNIYALCRSNYEKARDYGIDIDSLHYGKDVFRPSKVFRDIKDAVASVPARSFDYVMVTTKALPNLVDMPEIIAPAVKDGHTAIVLIQNGIGIEAPYEHRFPNNPIISVVSYLDARHDNRNRDLIIHGTTVAIALNLYHGYSDNHPSSTAGSSSMAAAVGQQALDTLVEAFNRGKVECVIVKSIQACRWQKLIWNGAFNPMSVLAGGRNTAEMLACPQFYQLVLDVMNEIYTAGCTVTGQSLDGGYYGGGPNIILKRTMDAPVPVYPSMLGDFKSGRPMEHQVILKNTIDIAKRHGVEMPRLETIYGHLLLLESSYLKNNERTSPS